MLILAGGKRSMVFLFEGWLAFGFCFLEFDGGFSGFCPLPDLFTPFCPHGAAEREKDTGKPGKEERKRPSGNKSFATDGLGYPGIFPSRFSINCSWKPGILRCRMSAAAGC